MLPVFDLIELKATRRTFFYKRIFWRYIKVNYI